MTTPARTFKDIFLCPDLKGSKPIKIPDYQRAFSWEDQQIETFIEDLKEYVDRPADYYFGHFIMEDHDGFFEIVDGQQRITTIVLFLMICSHLGFESEENPASLIERFHPVSYDEKAFKKISIHIDDLLRAHPDFSGQQKSPLNENAIAQLTGEPKQTRSLHRMLRAILQLNRAFVGKTSKPKLDRERIADYIQVILKSQCSFHIPLEKSAVTIFGMHNTRGVSLTTMEIVKAKLMKFVFDQDDQNRNENVVEIQTEFGKIYALEEALAASNFRGQLTLEQLFRLHCRAVDDGSKSSRDDFERPAENSSQEDILSYLDKRLHEANCGTQYAIDLAREFRKSTQIMCEELPEWDHTESLIGDVLILERNLSCQFFLLVCRRASSNIGNIDGKISHETLKLWERFLFIRNFHHHYHGLRHSYRDDFSRLFEEMGAEDATIATTLEKYLDSGFRNGITDNLTKLVSEFWAEHREEFLVNAYYSWSGKMKYLIYKYEVSKDSGANAIPIRSLVKDGISVEHILPQDWSWNWVPQFAPDERGLDDSREKEKKEFLEKFGRSINGLGNLLLLTAGENTAEGNKHPVDKQYPNYVNGGSYAEIKKKESQWRVAENWKELIHSRGDQIFQYMHTYFEIAK